MYGGNGRVDVDGVCGCEGSRGEGSMLREKKVRTVRTEWSRVRDGGRD